MSLEAGAVVGFFLGFAFGVGCALAVMYSIYMGGYRAAIADLHEAEQPERLRRAQAAAARKRGEDAAS